MSLGCTSYSTYRKTQAPAVWFKSDGLGPRRARAPACYRKRHEVEPYSPDHDKRTFECPQCDHAVTEIVKYK